MDYEFMDEEKAEVFLKSIDGLFDVSFRLQYITFILLLITLLI